MGTKTLFVFILTCQAAFSQLIDPDFVHEIKIQPVVHGTVVFEWNDITIYVDPYGGADKFKNLKDPDIIIITHAHGDHLNAETLKGLNTKDAVFVVPLSVAEELPKGMKKNVVILNNDDFTEVKAVPIKAFPMYNLPDDDTARHSKGWGNSYKITLNNKNIYISGDTEDIPEMRALKDIDVAFICMNLPFTMTEEQAASAVLDFKPTIVYPYHYRGRPNMSNTELFKKLVNDENPDIEVRLRDWYVK